MIHWKLPVEPTNISFSSALWGHLAWLRRVFLTLADNWIFPNPMSNFPVICGPLPTPVAKDYLSITLWNAGSNPEPQGQWAGNSGSLLTGVNYYHVFPGD